MALHVSCILFPSKPSQRCKLALSRRYMLCRYKQGRPLSCLDGVPYTVIDGIDALPYPTTAGTTFVSNRDLRPQSVIAHALSNGYVVGSLECHHWAHIYDTCLCIETGTAATFSPLLLVSQGHTVCSS